MSTKLYLSLAHTEADVAALLEAAGATLAEDLGACPPSGG
jgi:hypothetical protein